MAHRNNDSKPDTHDPLAFLELSDRYGWKLYQYLRKNTSDPRLLERIYGSVLNSVAKSYPGREVGDGQLYEEADRILAAYPLSSEMDAGIAKPVEKGRGKFFVTLVLLVIVNLLCLWVISGLMMEMGLIPYLNLGHAWVLNLLQSVIF